MESVSPTQGTANAKSTPTPTLLALTMEGVGSIGSDLGCLEIKDIECFPQFKCVHLHFPGPEILQATLNKYREKSLQIKLVDIAQDFNASLESQKKTSVLF